MRTEEHGALAVRVSKALARKKWTLQAAAVHAGVSSIEKMDEVHISRLDAEQLKQILRWANGERERPE